VSAATACGERVRAPPTEKQTQLSKLVVKVAAVAALVAVVEHLRHRIFAREACVHPARLRVDRARLVKQAGGGHFGFIREAQLFGQLFGDGLVVVDDVRGAVVEGEGDLLFLVLVGGGVCWGGGR